MFVVCADPDHNTDGYWVLRAGSGGQGTDEYGYAVLARSTVSQGPSQSAPVESRWAPAGPSFTFETPKSPAPVHLPGGAGVHYLTRTRKRLGTGAL